ncbi:hypothetical protein [Mycolicibacterium chubuense]|nr:hypothetical protein [Mycolicibacterium chubuense]
MVHLRWRTAQLMRAMVDGEGGQAWALRQAMRVEAVADADLCDEFRLLLGQFGHRTPVHLSEEVSRLWRTLRSLCVRCGRSSPNLDNGGVCVDCVVVER